MFTYTSKDILTLLETWRMEPAARRFRGLALDRAIPAARAETDVATADHRVTVSVTTGGAGPPVCVRGKVLQMMKSIEPKSTSTYVRRLNELRARTRSDRRKECEREQSGYNGRKKKKG